MPGYDRNVGAKRAREARAALGLAPGEPFACLLTAIEQRAELPVVVAPLSHGTAGCCQPLRPGVSILFVNGLEHFGRQRFTLAHEFGHHAMGHDAGVPDSVGIFSGRTLSSREVQANAFAGELLAPAAGVRDLVDGEPTLETAGRIAEHFGLSLRAAVVRLDALGLTSRYDDLLAEHADPELRAYVTPAERDDEIARIGRHLPRVSPLLAGTELYAVLHGEAAALPDVSRALPLLMR